MAHKSARVLAVAAVAFVVFRMTRSMRSRGRTLASEQCGAPPTSTALQQLLDAAVRAGAPPDRARAAVRAVLSTFTERLPPGERDEVLASLPADARALATPPRRIGEARPARTMPELVADVTAYGIPGGNGITTGHEARISESVLATLRTLEPEEASEIAAVLPPELRSVWNAATPA